MLRYTTRFRFLSSFAFQASLIKPVPQVPSFYNPSLLHKNLTHKLKQYHLCAHTVSGPFEEKSFMNTFLHLASHRDGHSKEEYFAMFKTLRENLDKIQKPNSVVALIHKIHMFDEYIDSNLQNQILKQTSKVFLNNYDVSSDNGDLLRAVVLVVSLQKIKDEGFYKEFFSVLYKNNEKLNFFNLLTTLESYTYNKWLFRVASTQEIMSILKTLSMKLQVRELQNFAKYSNVLLYLAKNTQQKRMNPKEAQELQTQIVNDINRLYDVILQLIVNDRNNKTLDLFAMTDVYISLESFNSILPKLKDKYSLFRKYYNSLVESYLPKGFLLTNVKYNPATIIPFLKRYYVVPPTSVHPQFSSFINQVFLKHYKEPEFRNLETYVYFLLFLAKTNSLNIPETIRDDINIQDLILQERNLFVLAKTLELFALCEQTNQEFLSFDKKELDTIEKVIFQIIHRLPKKSLVSPALLQVFQLMVALNRGNGEDWKTLLSTFANKEALKKLDHMELIIKLVPAGAVKTKSLYKVYSNISLTESSYYLKGVQLDEELTQILEKFWNTIEEILIERAHDIHPDKFPVILFHLVYANVFKNSYRKLYQIAQPILSKHLNVLDPRQLSEVIYAYSRVGEKADALMFSIAQKVLEEKLYNKMTPIEVSNLYWGFANAGIWHEDLIKACEKKLFHDVKNLPLDTYTQFCMALAINNRQLEIKEFDALNIYMRELLKDLSKPKKVFNIQHVLGILNSFNTLKNFHDLALWEEILGFLCAKKDLYQNNGLLYQYVYKLYIHLVLEKIQVPKRDELFSIIQRDYRSIVDYLKTSKKNVTSKLENNIKSVIQDNVEDLFGKGAKINEGNEVIVVHQGPAHELVLVNDISRIDEVIKEKKIPNLGARQLLAPYTVDIIVGNYAIEINGPMHYLDDGKNNLKEKGYNALKRSLFEKSEMKYMEIPYKVYRESDPNWKQKTIEYIKQRITELN